MTDLEPGSEAWLASVDEEIVDPGRAIVDPHHHLFDFPSWTYLVDELLADTGAGHRVVQTVYMECGSGYRSDGPDHLKPVGETDFVCAASAATRERAGDGVGAIISATVGHADLTLPVEQLDEVLDAHVHAGGGTADGEGIFRGIRHAGARDPHPEALSIPGRAPDGLYESEEFRRGVARLGERGFSYDTWHYHHQNESFADLALAVPGTTIVLDHFGTPLGVGPYAGKRDEIFAAWKDHMLEIAESPNVRAKLGGMAMPDNGFGWDTAARPPSSDEFVEAQGPWYRHAIACFGASRSMFESNFPVDRRSLSYRVLWNGLKKIASEYDEGDREALCSGTAASVYRLAAAS